MNVNMEGESCVRRSYLVLRGLPGTIEVGSTTQTQNENAYLILFKEMRGTVWSMFRHEICLCTVPPACQACGEMSLECYISVGTARQLAVCSREQDSDLVGSCVSPHLALLL